MRTLIALTALWLSVPAAAAVDASTATPVAVSTDAAGVQVSSVPTIALSTGVLVALSTATPVPIALSTAAVRRPWRSWFVEDSWPEGTTFSQSIVQGLGNSPGGGYHGATTEVSTPFGRANIYRLKLRVDEFKVLPTFSGVSHEYSGELTRELYHVTLRGRLGTAPPDAKYPAVVNGLSQSNQIRPSYHLAGGDVIFTLYGRRLGPEHPEKSAAVWEEDTPAPAPESFDRTWVTRFAMLYNNTDVHIQTPSNLLVAVENSWQFEARETWRERSSLAVQMGLDHYNKVLPNTVATVFFHNIQYYGEKQAVFGWPNNFTSVEGWQELGHGLRVEAGFTRLNLLNNQLTFLSSGELQWRSGPWEIRPGFYYIRRRATSSHRGVTLDVSYRL